MALRISTKEFPCSSDHSNCTYFLTKCCKGLTTWEKFGTNLWTKLILPKKECIVFWEPGRQIFEIDSVFSGSMIMPSLETMKPNNLPFVTVKIDFLGLRESQFPASFKHLFQSRQMFMSFFRINCYII